MTPSGGLYSYSHNRFLSSIQRVDGRMSIPVSVKLGLLASVA